MNINPLADANKDYFEALFNAVGVPIFVVDENLRIWGANPSAEAMQDTRILKALKRLCGEVFHCLHEKESAKECGETKFCKDCYLRNIVSDVSNTQQPQEEMVKLSVLREGKEKTIWLQISGKPLSYNGHLFTVLTLQEKTELIELRNIIPICSYCKNIRNDDEYWLRIEEYLASNVQIDLTHCICPDCLKEHYPQYADGIINKT
jgi:PAS domain-containing protein